MKKGDLAEAKQAYEDAMSRARTHIAAERYSDAVREAVSAWKDVVGMMRYDMKFAEAEFESLECVELVVRYAPLLLDHETLAQLERLLSENRWVERKTSANLAEKLAKARSEMRVAHQLWDQVERNPGVRAAEIAARLGGEGEWRVIAERREQMGLVRRVPEDASYRLWLAVDLSEQWIAKCERCGQLVHAAKRKLLCPNACPACGHHSHFILHGQAGPIGRGRS